MFLNEKIINSLFLKWLNLSLILVFLIIIIGGLTRLTNSGLSITECELFKGILFPLNENTRNVYFDQYKKIPQYKLINPNMNLEEFKIIFFWEYIHRLIARLIGLFFLIPLIFFYFSKKINQNYLKICYLILFLIIFQGIVGWFMVKSGLIHDVTVSHYRLSLHLILAIFIISIIFWLKRNIAFKKDKKFFKFSIKYLPFHFLLLVIYVQIIIGAFVSGLDAGKIYQTWPLMGSSYVPDDLVLNHFMNLFSFNNHSLVQFYHRNLAYFLVSYVIVLTIYIYKKKLITLYKPIKILILFLFLQALLGIFTLMSDLNIYLASIHQITSVLLVFSALNLYYFKAK